MVVSVFRSLEESFLLNKDWKRYYLNELQWPVTASYEIPQTPVPRHFLLCDGGLADNGKGLGRLDRSVAVVCEFFVIAPCSYYFQWAYRRRQGFDS